MTITDTAATPAPRIPADDLIDRAYLLGLAIDNLPADVANMEV